MSHHVGEIGTPFTVKWIAAGSGAAYDISGTPATRQIIFIKPNGTKLTKTAALDTDGKDGLMTYVLEDILDAAGVWWWYGHVSIGSPTTEKQYTDAVSFVVRKVP